MADTANSWQKQKLANSKINRARRKIKAVQDKLSYGNAYTHTDNDMLVSATNQLMDAIILLDFDEDFFGD